MKVEQLVLFRAVTKMLTAEQQLTLDSSSNECFLCWCVCVLGDVLGNNYPLTSSQLCTNQKEEVMFCLKDYT